VKQNSINRFISFNNIMVGYEVANANEIIVVTGLGIKDFVLTKKRWVWPLFQKVSLQCSRSGD
jgi:hypothetical protein